MRKDAADWNSVNCKPPTAVWLSSTFAFLEFRKRGRGIENGKYHA